MACDPSEHNKCTSSSCPSHRELGLVPLERGHLSVISTRAKRQRAEALGLFDQRKNTSQQTDGGKAQEITSTIWHILAPPLHTCGAKLVCWRVFIHFWRLLISHFLIPLFWPIIHSRFQVEAQAQDQVEPISLSLSK